MKVPQTWVSRLAKLPVSPKPRVQGNLVSILILPHPKSPVHGFVYKYKIYPHKLCNRYGIEYIHFTFTSNFVSGIIIIVIIILHAPCQCVAPLTTNSLHSDLSKASSIASSKVRLCRDRSLFKVAIQEV